MKTEIKKEERWADGVLSKEQAEKTAAFARLGGLGGLAEEAAKAGEKEQFELLVSLRDNLTGLVSAPVRVPNRIVAMRQAKITARNMDPLMRADHDVIVVGEMGTRGTIIAGCRPGEELICKFKDLEAELEAEKRI